ncbi:MAG: RIP metalloprotease RseP [Desulfobulbaceae bacterium]|uniref:Zinc metalloprotease n=1 Tax=Candidatus Desulfobia pelagia TaxID=2841692 RepID=A0A8J6NDP1_9BACT|nr:RIP metalloprotease RseP [Candidatus Desulfobia pelagia]
MNTILSFIIVLGILIFVHELGHFLVAKLCNVKVLKFSLGFGPKVFGRHYGDTEYLISAFPLGGYVKMCGENTEEEVTSEDLPHSFSHKTVWQRFLIVLAGPVFNILFAVFLFFLIFSIAGLPVPKSGTEIGSITVDSPAQTAGLKAGDIILAINGQETTEWSDVSRLIKESEGNPTVMAIFRDGAELVVTGQAEIQEVKNIFGEVVDERFMLGISRSTEVIYEKASLVDAFLAGISQTWMYIYLTMMGIIKIVQQVVPASELGGPILIAQMAGQQMEAGWVNLFFFMGLVSVNLGILNLFPIPILDGGHLVFFSLEAIRRKPLEKKTMEKFQQFGLLLLGSLMIFVFYNDIVRIFTRG